MIGFLRLDFMTLYLCDWIPEVGSCDWIPEVGHTRLDS